MILAEKIDDKWIQVSCEMRDKDAVKTIPGTRWHAESKSWRLPLAISSCFALRGTFKQNLEIGESLNDWAAGFLENVSEPVKQLLAQADTDGKEYLYPFQRIGARFLAIVERGLLTDEMGTGKSVQVIEAARLLLNEGKKPFPMLIVAPNTVKRSWKRELHKWWPELRVEIVEGSQKKKAASIEKAVTDEADVVVINWEALRAHSRLAPYGAIRLKRCVECRGDASHAQCEVHLRELNNVAWQTVVADEAHRGKNPQAKQTRALWAASAGARFRWALTGTPIANTPDELWTLLHFIEPQEWPSRVGFINRYCSQTWNAWGALQVTGLNPNTEPELRKSLDLRMLRRTKSEVLKDLPAKLPAEIRFVTLSAKERKSYNEMRDDLVAQLDGGDVVGWNPLTQVTRLLQLASSNAEIQSSESEDDVKISLVEPSSKLDAMMDLLENDLQDEFVVIASVSRQLIELAEKRLEKAKISFGSVHGNVSTIQREKNVQDFQDGKLKTMLLTVGAGGEGITLHRAAVIVFLQRSWSLVQNKQTEDRIHRIGQEREVQIIDLVASDTIEEKVLERVVEKGERLEEVVRDKDRLRELL